MVSGQSLQDIQDNIERNELKIDYLQEINTTLKDRFDIQSNLKLLQAKFNNLQKDEKEQTEKYNQSRKMYLTELESKGSELCKEHARLLHQIEHVQWHLDRGAKHEQCAPEISCKSSATSLNRSSHNKSFDTVSLENTAERLIRSIADLRRKIFAVKQKLEKEIKRKRCVEKNLADLRKDISRQKKIISSRRAIPALPSQPQDETKQDNSSQIEAINKDSKVETTVRPVITLKIAVTINKC